jgi:hypothetical protein
MSGEDESAIVKEADFELARWAKWSRMGICLGLPTRSVTEKANEGGITRGTPRPPTTMPDGVALSDRVIGIMEKQNHAFLRKVIKLHYERGLPQEGICVALGLSRGQCYRAMRQAKVTFWRIRDSIPKTKRDLL